MKTRCLLESLKDYKIRSMIWNCLGTIVRRIHWAASGTAAVRATVACMCLLYLSYLPHYRNVWHNWAVPPPDPILIACQISASYGGPAFSCLLVAMWRALAITAAQTKGRRNKTSVEGQISVAGQKESMCIYNWLFYVIISEITL